MNTPGGIHLALHHATGVEDEVPDVIVIVDRGCCPQDHSAWLKLFLKLELKSCLKGNSHGQFKDTEGSLRKNRTVTVIVVDGVQEGGFVGTVNARS